MCLTKISIFLPELKRPTFHLSIWCLNYFGQQWSPDSPAPYFHLPREEFTVTPTWPACVPIVPLSCPRPHVAMHAHGGFPILSMVPRGHTCCGSPILSTAPRGHGAHKFPILSTDSRGHGARGFSILSTDSHGHCVHGFPVLSTSPKAQQED